MLFLAGDIGGTKALFQLVDYNVDSFEMRSIGQQRYLCHEFDSLESIISLFLSSLGLDSPFVESACFGLPGPVTDSRVVQLTNLPWVVDALKIEQACSIQTVSFVNDFYAAALGVEMLTEQDIFPLYLPDGVTKQQSLKSNGHRLVVGAGTGLGVAPVFFNGECYRPIGSEGGHFDFAPISETQQYLLTWLWKQWEHVSYERVLSGPGLETLYQFFQVFDCPTTYSCEDLTNVYKNHYYNTQKDSLGSLIADKLVEHKPDALSAVEIYQAAEQGDPVAVMALTEFVTIYGAFVGAVALVWNAPQGVYLAGGIAGKLINWMQKPVFQKAFLEKGRMSRVVANMPVYLVTDETLGLRGAMHQNFIMWQAQNRAY
ncbi:MAG: glucokinase [Thiomicrorhabdus sp.]|nr:MAG: glucokinase [Thiomicrorhabdus sp.]